MRTYLTLALFTISTYVLAQECQNPMENPDEPACEQKIQDYFTTCKNDYSSTSEACSFFANWCSQKNNQEACATAAYLKSFAPTGDCLGINSYCDTEQKGMCLFAANCAMNDFRNCNINNTCRASVKRMENLCDAATNEAQAHTCILYMINAALRGLQGAHHWISAQCRQTSNAKSFVIQHAACSIEKFRKTPQPIPMHSPVSSNVRVQVKVTKKEKS